MNCLPMNRYTLGHAMPALEKKETDVWCRCFLLGPCVPTCHPQLNKATLHCYLSSHAECLLGARRMCCNFLWSMGHSLDAVRSLHSMCKHEWKFLSPDGLLSLILLLHPWWGAAEAQIPAEAASLSSKLSLSLPQFRVMVMESTPMGNEWLEPAGSRKADLKRSGSHAFLHNTYLKCLMGTFWGFQLGHGSPWSQLKVTLPRWTGV